MRAAHERSDTKEIESILLCRRSATSHNGAAATTSHSRVAAALTGAGNEQRRRGRVSFRPRRRRPESNSRTRFFFASFVSCRIGLDLLAGARYSRWPRENTASD
jgi:hypothetical protein